MVREMGESTASTRQVVWRAAALVLCACCSAACRNGSSVNRGNSTGVAPKMELSETEVNAGALLDVRYHGEPLRGVLYVLRRADLERDEVSYYLVSDAVSGTPSWTSGDNPPSYPQIGVVGNGPDTVVIPSVAPPGDYELCASTRPDPLCSWLSVSQS